MYVNPAWKKKSRLIEPKRQRMGNLRFNYMGISAGTDCKKSKRHPLLISLSHLMCLVTLVWRKCISPQTWVTFIPLGKKCRKCRLMNFNMLTLPVQIPTSPWQFHAHAKSVRKLLPCHQFHLSTIYNKCLDLHLAEDKNPPSKHPSEEVHLSSSFFQL